jgi:hypothetical protein
MASRAAICPTWVSVAKAWNRQPPMSGEGELGVADDHIAVTDAALAQIPDEHRHGGRILVRVDGAGGSKRWLAHLRFLRDEGSLDVSFSVGFTCSGRLDRSCRRSDRPHGEALRRCRLQRGDRGSNSPG